MRLFANRRRLVLAIPLALAASLSGADAASAADVNCSLFGGPCDIAFPDTNFGSTSTKSVEFTNDGPPGSALNASISSGAEFSLSGNTCTGAPLASGATCTFNVIFTPTGGTNHASSGTLMVDAGGFPPIFVTGGLSGNATGGIPAAPTPEVTAVSPTSGTAGQSAVVTLTGTDFGATSGDLTDVSLLCGPSGGNHTGTDVTWISSTSLTVRVPALSVGVSCTFRVTAGGGNSAPPTPSTPTYTYNAPPPPTITSVSPTSGTAGQTAVVTLTGTNFGTTSSDLEDVDLDCGADGTHAATNVTWASATSATARVPARSAGTSCTFTVTVSGQTSAASTATYRYNPRPAITGVSPASGTAGETAIVTLTGTDFGTSSSDLEAVTLDCDGDTVAGTDVTWISSTSLSVRVPARDINDSCQFAVTVKGETSALSSEGYQYVEPVPTVTAISPTSAPSVEGAHVTIVLTGKHLGSSASDVTAVQAVCFVREDGRLREQSHTGTDVVWHSSTSLSFKFPMSPAGTTCAFRIYTPQDASEASTATFTFTAAAPTVTAVAPTSGPAHGSNIVTLSGTDFGSASSDLTAVTIDCGAAGSVASPEIAWISARSITARVPALPAGNSCTFKVTANGQTSTASTATYTYNAPTPPPAPPGIPVPSPSGGSVITGTDGSSVNTNDIQPPGGGTVSVQNGSVVVPSGGTSGGTLSADVTKGTTPSSTPSNTPPQPQQQMVRVALNFRVAFKSSLDLPAFITDFTTSLAKAAGVDPARFTVAQINPTATSSAVRPSARRAAADPAPCTATTPAGTTCRVTWKLPKVAPGAWSMNLTYGGLSIPITYVAQPALKLSGGSRCVLRGATGSVPRVKADKGSKVAVFAVKLSGSQLRCSGKAGTTNRKPTGKPKLVSKNAGKPASLQQGLRKPGKGDYLLVWLATKSGTPSADQTTFVKVR